MFNFLDHIPTEGIIPSKEFEDETFEKEQRDIANAKIKAISDAEYEVAMIDDIEYQMRKYYNILHRVSNPLSSPLIVPVVKSYLIAKDKREAHERKVKEAITASKEFAYETLQNKIFNKHPDAEHMRLVTTANLARTNPNRITVQATRRKGRKKLRSQMNFVRNRFFKFYLAGEYITCVGLLAEYRLYMKALNTRHINTLGKACPSERYEGIQPTIKARINNTPDVTEVTDVLTGQVTYRKTLKLRSLKD